MPIEFSLTNMFHSQVLTLAPRGETSLGLWRKLIGFVCRLRLMRAKTVWGVSKPSPKALVEVG